MPVLIELLVAVIASTLGAGFFSGINKLLEKPPTTAFGKAFREFALKHGLISENTGPTTQAVLFEQLTEATKNMDAVISRVQEYTGQRQTEVAKLEVQLTQLTKQEGELRETIKNLQGVPLPAAEYFATLVNKGEKSGARRDYTLFTAGAVVSVIVAIILKHFGFA